MDECGGFENRCPDFFGTVGSNPTPSATEDQVDLAKGGFALINTENASVG